MSSMWTSSMKRTPERERERERERVDVSAWFGEILEELRLRLLTWDQLGHALVDVAVDHLVHLDAKLLGNFRLLLLHHLAHDGHDVLAALRPSFGFNTDTEKGGGVGGKVSGEGGDLGELHESCFCRLAVVRASPGVG